MAAKYRRIEDSAMRRFKNMNLIAKTFGKKAVKVYEAMDPKTFKSLEDIISDSGLDEEKVKEVIEFMLSNDMAEIKEAKAAKKVEKEVEAEETPVEEEAPSEAVEKMPEEKPEMDQPEEQPEEEEVVPEEESLEIKPEEIVKEEPEEVPEKPVESVEEIPEEKPEMEQPEEQPEEETEFEIVPEETPGEEAIEFENEPEEEVSTEEEQPEEQSPEEETEEKVKEPEELEVPPAEEETPSEEEEEEKFAPLTGHEEEDIFSLDEQKEGILVVRLKETNIILKAKMKLMTVLKFARDGRLVFDEIKDGISSIEIVMKSHVNLQRVEEVLSFLSSEKYIKLEVMSRKEIMSRFGYDAYMIYKKYGKKGVLFYLLLGKDVKLKEIMSLISETNPEKVVEIFQFVRSVLGIDIPVDKDILIKRLMSDEE